MYRHINVIKFTNISMIEANDERLSDEVFIDELGKCLSTSGTSDQFLHQKFTEAPLHFGVVSRCVLETSQTKTQNQLLSINLKLKSFWESLVSLFLINSLISKTCFCIYTLLSLSTRNISGIINVFFSSKHTGSTFSQLPPSFYFTQVVTPPLTDCICWKTLSALLLSFSLLLSTQG